MFVIYNTRIRCVVSKPYNTKEEAQDSIAGRVREGAIAEALVVKEK